MYTVFFNLVEKILHTYVYHFIGSLGNCEALHEITDLVHEMLIVCAPIHTLMRCMTSLALRPG